MAKINFKDYLKALKLIKSDPELKERFDDNRDGVLDPDELEKGAAILGGELTGKSEPESPESKSDRKKRIARKLKRKPKPRPPLERMSWRESIQEYPYSNGLFFIVNLLPVIGVLYFDWKVIVLIALYWAELVIEGGMTVVKMVTKKILTGRDFRSRWDLAGFILGYSTSLFFWAFFVITTFAPPELVTDPVYWFWEQSWFWVALGGLFIHHVVSYMVHFIRREEYYIKTMRVLMSEPIGRLIPLQFSVVLGGFLIAATGEIIWLLVLLIGLKMVVEMEIHSNAYLREITERWLGTLGK